MSSLVQGDLDGILLDLVSIDQYQSKLSDDNIVVAFTFKILEAANDVREFLDRGEFGILDTEVIMTADLTNNYMLLIEFNRDKKFLHYILKVCKYLINLSDVKKFKFISYLGTEYVTLNRSNLIKYVRLIKVDKAEILTKKMIFYFFNKNVKFDKNAVIVPCYAGKLRLKYIGRTTEELVESFVKVNNIDLLDQEKVAPIFIGDQYHIINLGKYIAIKNNDTDAMLMFENLDYNSGN